MGLGPLWAQTATGDVLHAVDSLVDDPEDWSVGLGRTVCGVSSTLSYPGVLSRLGAFRCRSCCRLLDVPAGKGHPRNDRRLRPVFGFPPFG
jgi:hypothetical protein